MKQPDPSTPPIRHPHTASIEALLAEPPGVRVSIYLPILENPGFSDQDQPQKALTTQIGKVRRALEEGSAELAEELVPRLEAVSLTYENVGHGTRGVAVFCGPKQIYVFAMRDAVEAFTSVTRVFAIRPLLAEWDANQSYRVLRLTDLQVALFEGDRYGLRECQNTGVPTSLEDALGTEIGRAGQGVQAHSSGPGGGAPIRHGHGGAASGKSVDRDRFHTLVAGAVRKHWARASDPLILASDEAHQGRFRARAELPHLLADGVPSGPEDLSTESLRNRTWPLVAAWKAEKDARAIEGLGSALAHQRASDDLGHILSAASTGRVRELWLDAGVRWDGREFLDVMTRQVVRSGGSVHFTAPGGLLGGRAIVATLHS